VAYTPLGIVVALTFIGLPFVVRTLQPVIEDIEPESRRRRPRSAPRAADLRQERSFPAIFPALLTGFTLAFSRAIGEYGSVIFIAGNMPLISEITPLLIISKLEQYDVVGATALAVVMLVISFVLLLVINALQWWAANRHKNSDRWKWRLARPRQVRHAWQQTDARHAGTALGALDAADGIGARLPLLLPRLPLVAVFVEALAQGCRSYLEALKEPETWRTAIWLTMFIALAVLPFNILFGVAAAWAIAKFEFKGKSLLITLIDLPFAVSPVVAGLIFILLFGAQGYFGPWLAAHDIKIIFAVPGMFSPPCSSPSPSSPAS
jgi:ABC-type sulfate transport system permease subunit